MFGFRQVPKSEMQIHIPVRIKKIGVQDNSTYLSSCSKIVQRKQHVAILSVKVKKHHLKLKPN